MSAVMLRLLLLPLALALAPVSVPAATPPSIVAPADLHPGDRAVVRTVFQGDSVESFDAEILGVLSTGRTEGDLIVARATSERVVRTGVAAGMSGSPVYVNGRLVGALSSGWTFSREPIFGITPIGEMLQVLDLPSAGDTLQTAGPAGLDLPSPAAAPRFRELTWEGGERGPEGIEPPYSPPAGVEPAAALPTPIALPMACAGLHPVALDVVRPWLAPLGFSAVPGGHAVSHASGALHLEPGSAVAVDVLRGDLQLSAIGTLTWRDGDKVLIFGHPFFQSGDVRMPLSTAEITTIVASQASSFKLGVSGREAGVVTQDRRAAVAGRLGGRARLLPFSVAVHGPQGTQNFHFESVEDRTLAPVLVGTAAINGLLESGGVGANQTLRWTLRVVRPGAPPLTLSDVVAGESPPSDLMASVVAPLRFLWNNPFSRFAVDSLAIGLAVEPGRQQWSLRSARVLEATVRPGGRVHVRCEVERWRGARETRELDLTVPEEAPDGRALLWVGGGAELSRYEARELPGRYRPVSLDDAWRRLAASRPSDALYGALFLNSPDLTRDGSDYPELPSSALAVLAGGQGAGDVARKGGVARLDEQHLPLGGLTRGELLLQVTIDSKAP